VKLVENLDPRALTDDKLVAQSNEFAIYEGGNDTYLLVHRHEGVRWQAITISGDALFRILELMASATRRLYRNVAGDLSRSKNPRP
jgi:hypothetical protein